MRITCPHCGFTKELATAHIPANVVRVTCPTCRQPFPLEKVEESPPAAAEIQDITANSADAEATVPPETIEPERVPEDATSPDPEPAGIESDKDELKSAEPVEPASIGSRYAAMLIDAMLIMSMVLILRFGLTLLGNGIQLEGQIILGASFMLFALTLGFAYHTLFIGICGQTPGKILLRIRVIATDDAAITYRQAMLREVFGKILSLPLLLGYLMAMFNPRHLAAHDKIADTCVVKLTPEATVD